MKITTILQIGLPLGVLFFSACKKNPVSIDNKPLETTIQTNIPANSIDTSGTVTLSWNNDEQKNEFRFSIDGKTWSNWSTRTIFSDLFDDGDHVFKLQSRVIRASTTVYDTIYFKVKTLKDPAVYLYPRKAIIKDGLATFTLNTKGLPESHSLKLVISGGVLSSVNNKFSKSLDVILLTDDNTINLGVGPQSTAIQGDMALLDLAIKPAGSSDTSNISISECIVRDSDHNDVNLKTIRGAIAVSPLTISEN
ncbi:MAG TPA: hypothetical protein VHP36_00395 [Chitinispirillaceae bacterium]|nr:hypothetical protein [Chitinispirillaceae bacterium]